MQTPSAVAAALEMSPETVRSRLAAIDLDEPARARLRLAGEAAAAAAPAFLDALYDRLRGFPESAALLSSEAQVTRLKAQQRQYLAELFGADIDWDYALRRLWVGVVHHRVRLSPQWFLTTYAHIICAHVPVLFATAPDRATALEQVVALVKSACFDASLGLEAYGRVEEAALWQRTASAHASDDRRPATEGRAATTRPASAAGGSQATTYARIRLTGEAAAERRQYVGLTDDDIAVLRRWRPTVTERTPAVLDEFYAFLGAHPETAALVPADLAGRLKQQVASYWMELVDGAFDRPYAASRMRVGVIHEKIGLGASWYLAGLARQVCGLLRGLDVGDPEAEARIIALVRAVFFDVSFVIDAYMDARADTLLRLDGYARQLVAGLASAVAVVDAHGRLRSANRTLVTMAGGDAAVLYMLPLDRALPIPEAAALVTALRTQMAAGGAPRLVGSGHLGARRLQLTAVALTGEGGGDGTIALVIDDVTDIVRIASDLETERGQFEQLADGVGFVLWELDPASWTITAINAAALELTGFRDVAFLGRPSMWLQQIAEADRAYVEARVAALQPGERTEVDYRWRRADGAEVWLRSWLHLRVTAGTRRVLGATVDVTAARQRDQLRLDALTATAGGVAHVVNNCLTAVIGGIELYGLEAGGLEATPQLRAALDATQKAAAMASRLLAFAGRQRLEAEVLTISDVVRAAVPRLPALLGTLPVTLDLADDLWPCHADRRMVGSVLDALLRNASAAMPHGGGVRIVTRNVPASAVPADDEARGRDWVEWTVSDTGIGMTDEVRRQALDPFFTTHSMAVSSGLGLSMVYGFITQCGGHLRLESSTGQGTTVRLRFPRHDGPLGGHPGRQPVALLIEDDQPVRTITAAMIRALGYRVVDTGVVADARRLAGELQPDVLVADIVVGQGTDGIQLARDLVAAQPTLAVVLVSGYAQSTYDISTLPAGVPFLQKPLSLASLGEGLRQARRATV